MNEKKKFESHYFTDSDDDFDEKPPKPQMSKTPRKTTPPFAPSPQLASTHHVSVSGSYSSTGSVLEPLPAT